MAEKKRNAKWKTLLLFFCSPVCTKIYHIYHTFVLIWYLLESFITVLAGHARLLAFQVFTKKSQTETKMKTKQRTKERVHLAKPSSSSLHVTSKKSILQTAQSSQFYLKLKQTNKPIGENEEKTTRQNPKTDRCVFSFVSERVDLVPPRLDLTR